MESIEALSAIIRDDHRENAKRRGRAARRIGELLEPGATLPEPVLDLLNSNLHDLRSAAVEAIARVKPRQPELIGRLHDVHLESQRLETRREQLGDRRGASRRVTRVDLNQLNEQRRGGIEW